MAGQQFKDIDPSFYSIPALKYNNYRYIKPATGLNTEKFLG
jgi:hypothetical protein